MKESFDTASRPDGHGFTPADAESGSACYTFEPKADALIRVLVLDDTQRDDVPCDNGDEHGSLDQERWDWLVRELDKGQADAKLMTIDAHLPIGVEEAGSPMGWSSTGCRRGRSRSCSTCSRNFNVLRHS